MRVLLIFFATIGAFYFVDHFFSREQKMSLDDVNRCLNHPGGYFDRLPDQKYFHCYDKTGKEYF